MKVITIDPGNCECPTASFEDVSDFPENNYNRKYNIQITDEEFADLVVYQQLFEEYQDKLMEIYYRKFPLG